MRQTKKENREKHQYFLSSRIYRFHCSQVEITKLEKQRIDETAKIIINYFCEQFSSAICRKFGALVVGKQLKGLSNF